MNPPTLTRRIINGLYEIQFRTPHPELDGDTRLVGVLVALLAALALTSLFDRSGAQYRRSEWVLDGHIGSAARLIRDSDRPDRVRADILHYDPENIHTLRLWKRVAVDAGQAYAATFRIRADEPRTVDGLLIQGHLPFQSIGESTPINVTEDWQEKRLVFFSPMTDTDVHLAFELGGSAASVELADVAFSPLPIESRPWRLYVSPNLKARLAARDGRGEHVRVVIDESGENDASDIELVRPVGLLEQGRIYSVRVRARSDSSCQVTMNLTSSRPPWKNLGFSRQLSLEPDWQTFEFQFIAADSVEGKLSFALGMTPCGVEVADVVVTESNQP